jgi:hypothetical protein
MATPFFKDNAAFVSGSGACYRPMNSDQLYTRANFFALALGDEELAKALFEQAAGETPEQLLDALLRATPDARFPPLPPGSLDAYRPLSDTNGRYLDSQALDAVWLSGGTLLATELQGMLDGQYGYICLHGEQPGVLFCKAYPMDDEHTPARLARSFGFLPAEFPEIGAFVCSDSESSQALLCVWVAVGKLAAARLQQLLAELV